MCNHCADTDPRDEIIYGAKALRGLRDLVTEIHQVKNDFEVVTPGGLAELLEMVEGRIATAADKLQNYAPRD